MTIERHYTHSDLPAVATDTDKDLDDVRRQILIKLYSEVCSTWRALMDVRFKLLGLVPFVTVAIMVFLLPGSDLDQPVSALVVLVVGAIGLAVTSGLLVYEIRNSELYDDLISRGRRIEAELGIQTGMFRGRRKAKRRRINHGTAIFLIYVAAIGGWFFVVAWSLVQMIAS